MLSIGRIYQLTTNAPGIFRGSLSFEQGFTRIPNTWLRDDRLGYRAKGLLAYLLSHEVGYTITLGQIARESNDGRHAIRAAIDELVSNGYLQTRRTHDERGWNAGLAWLLQDPNPKGENPTLENPTLENRPALEENLLEKNTSKRTYAQNESERLFSEFWEAYPRREGKAAASKAFTKAIREVEPQTIIDGARRYGKDFNLPAKQYIPHPATWLNDGRWDDDALPERERTPEEKAEYIRQVNERKRLVDLEHTAKLKAEMRAAEEAVRLNPPKRCEHDSIAVMCRICNRNA